jgi:hypothetical protein
MKRWQESWMLSRGCYLAVRLVTRRQPLVIGQLAGKMPVRANCGQRAAGRTRTTLWRDAEDWISQRRPTTLLNCAAMEWVNMNSPQGEVFWGGSCDP